MGEGDGARSIGEQLRAQREARGESLRDVENATKIRTRYLAALEADDIKTLPADVYALGFLRSYARHLGLDAEGLVREWRLMLTPPVPSAPDAAGERPRPVPPAEAVAPPPPPPPMPRRRERVSTPGPVRSRTAPPRTGTAVGAVVVLVLVLVALIYGLRHHRPSVPAAATTTPPKTSAPASHSHHHRSSRVQQAKLVTTADTTGQLTMTLTGATPHLSLTFHGDCWVEVWVNGTTSNPYGDTYYAGESLTVSGQQSVEVRLGNPNVVSAIVNGHALGTVGKGYARNILVQTSS